LKVLSIALIIFFTLTNCRSASPQQAEEDNRILEKVGKDYSIEKNISKTFALCKKGSDLNISFSIIRIKDLSVVVQEIIPKGSITWESDMKIKVMTQPGIIKKDDNPNSYIRIIDLNKFLLTDN
jgi:hypothetical protein